MEEGIYYKIPSELRDSIDIIRVEPKDFDYSISDKWVELKKQSDKAFRKLKDLEFEIRNA